jgi:hypothetical protein
MSNGSKSRIYKSVMLRRDGSLPRLEAIRNKGETWDDFMTRLLNEREESSA